MILKNILFKLFLLKKTRYKHRNRLNISKIVEIVLNFIITLILSFTLFFGIFKVLFKLFLLLFFDTNPLLTAKE